MPRNRCLIQNKEIGLISVKAMVRPALTKNFRIKGIVVMIPHYEFLIFNVTY